ncbi:E3 ubiquitin-protein ligase RNFT1-like [Ciona intestinalis]
MDEAISKEEAHSEIKEEQPKLESEITQSETNSSNMEGGKSLSDQKVILKQALPLLCLLGVNLLYQNSSNIFLFVSLMIVFDHANNVVLSNCMLHNGRSALKLLTLSVFCALIFILALPIVSEYWICNLLSLKIWSGHVDTFWGVLYSVCIFDFLMKYVTIFVKCLILLPKRNTSSLDKRGGFLIMCESVSQIIRGLLPIPEWVKYIVSAPSCVALILCWSCAVLYLVIKFSVFKSKLKILSHGWKLFRSPLIVGSAISEENAATINQRTCPICHSKLTEPVALSPCGHTFCHGCCQEWFNHESHCPVCSSDAMNALIMGSTKRLPKPDVIAPKSSKWKTAATEYILQLC